MDKRDMVGGSRWQDRQIQMRRLAMEERSRKIDDQRAQLDLEMRKQKSEELKADMELRANIIKGYHGLDKMTLEQVGQLQRSLMKNLNPRQLTVAHDTMMKLDQYNGMKERFAGASERLALKAKLRNLGRDISESESSQWGTSKLRTAIQWLENNPDATKLPANSMDTGQFKTKSTVDERGSVTYIEIVPETAPIPNYWQKLENENMTAAEKRKIAAAKADVEIAKSKATAEMEVEKAASKFGLTKDQTTRAQKFADEIGKAPEIRGWRKSTQALRTLERLAAPGEETGQKDMALIFTFMKTLDPTSVVREGEYAAAAGSSGLIVQLVEYANKVKKGEFMNQKVRAKFVEAAKLAVEASRESALASQNDLIKQAVNEGIPKNFFMDIVPESTDAPKIIRGQQVQTGQGNFTVRQIGP